MRDNNALKVMRMNKLFIDTNIFESKGFNFDQRNILIKLLIENAKNKNYEYYNLSVIDKEIISHITDRCSSRKRELFRRFKWIKNYVKEKDIIHFAKYNNLKFINCACKLTEDISDFDNINSKRKIIILRNLFSFFIIITLLSKIILSKNILFCR